MTEQNVSFLSDKAIIDLYFARDEQAIGETDRKYGAACRRVVMNILEDREDTEECVNDTYLRAWNTIPPTLPQSLRAYLERISRNLALNRLRAASRRIRPVDTAVEELAECLPAPEETPDDLPRLFDEFLGTLPDTDRRFFVLRYWHALPVARIAQAAGVTPNAVSHRLLNVREKLRSFLRERGITV